VFLKEIVFFILMVFSALMLVYEWLSIYNRINYKLILYSILLVLSTGALLITMHLRMITLRQELENTRRLIFVNMNSLEKRIEKTLNHYLKVIEERINEFGRRMYR